MVYYAPKSFRVDIDQEVTGFYYHQVCGLPNFWQAGNNILLMNGYISLDTRSPPDQFLDGIDWFPLSIGKLIGFHAFFYF